jgi:hypothetical protein
MDADLRIATLAYALARARAFLTVIADDLGAAEREWARGILADVDRALEKTIYSASRAENGNS